MLWRARAGLRSSGILQQPWRAPRNRALTTGEDLAVIIKALKRRNLPIQFDNLNPTNTIALDSLFPGYQTGNRKQSYLDIPLATNYLVYFPLLVKEPRLLEDGTDTRHAPASTFKYRLWAGGTFATTPGVSLNVSARTKVALVEKIGEVKMVGSKMFVQVHRAVVDDPTFPATVSKITPIKDSSIRIPAMSNLVDNVFATDDKVVLRESRWLCFMEDKPASVPSVPDKATRRPVPNAADVFVVLEIKITSAMLFRFSALTYNAHTIHIDPEYTRNVYGLPNLLVHGPMTLHLLHRHAREVIFGAHRVSQYESIKIEYKNSVPIFVGETVSIGSTRPQPVPGKEGTMTATMWISKKIEGEYEPPFQCVSASLEYTLQPRHRESAAQMTRGGPTVTPAKRIGRSPKPRTAATPPASAPLPAGPPPQADESVSFGYTQHKKR